MVNRNILDQNGFNSRNILNIRNQKLKDGKAIKINTSITNKNEIDVNMKTNTTEQTTIGDTDLFLLSDTTGANIKHITGINLKQKALLHLVGGTNINLTNDSSNDTVINLDDNIDTAGSITCKDFVKIKNTNNNISSFGGILFLEGSVPQVSYPFRYKQQVFHTNSGDAYQILAEDNASNQRVLFELHSGTNNSTTHTVNFHTANLTNILKINTYDANVLTVNNNNQQFLVKDTNKNFSSGNFLAVDSSSKITPINILGGNNINISSTTNDITINLDTTLTGITNINSTTISQLLTISAHPSINTLGGVLKLSKPSKSGITNNRDFEILTDLQNSDNNRVLVFRALSSNYDFLTMGDFSGSNQIRANAKMIIQPSADDYTNDEFMLHIKSFEDKDCRVCIESDMVQGGGEDHHPTLLFRQDGGTVKTEIGLNVSNRFYLHHPATNTDHCRVEFFLGLATMDATSLVLQLSPLAVDCNKKLNVSTDGINTDVGDLKLKVSNNEIISLSTDKIDVNKKVIWLDNENEKGYIRFDNNMFEIQSSNCDLRLGKRGGSGSSNDIVIDTSSININKSLLFTSSSNTNRFIVLQGGDVNSDSRIIGYDNRIDIIGKETSSTNPAIRFISGSTTVFQIHQDRTNMYKPLYMNSTSSLDRPIYLHHNEAFFVKYKFDNSTGNKINGTDLGGYGGSNGTDFASVRITATDANYPGTLAEFFPKNIKMYKHAGVILDNNSHFPLSENDAFTIRKDGLCNLLIRSFSDYSQIQLQASNNYNGSIAYTGSQFRIETVGQEFKTVASHHNFFNGSSLRLSFQSDSNLVVYNGSTVKFASNDSQNAHSSRDYKKNINDLVESESINVIRNINPVSFEYLEQYWDENDRCNACNCDLRKGFIWEDTKPILPQATRSINMNNPDEPTTKTLDLKMVIPDLTKTVQYLLNEISTLKEQLITQSTLISNLQSQLNNI